VHWEVDAEDSGGVADTLRIANGLAGYGWLLIDGLIHDDVLCMKLPRHV
jgi:hypothetical protein